MKLPKFLKERLKRIAPYRDYFRRELAIARKAPSPNLAVMTVQFYEAFKEGYDKRLNEDQNFKQAFIASEDFTLRLTQYLKSIDKLPEQLTGAEIGLIGQILPGIIGPNQPPPPPPKKAIDTEQILLIGGIALVGIYLITR